jgi:bifunctional non-homologous end joining protein LigD
MVRPKLVCEVAFAEWTEDGELRQTTFLGWRDDKDLEETVIERGDAL